VITTVSLQTQRAGFMARLWMSCCGDLAARALGFLAVLIGFGAVVWNLHAIG
jgi:hypothetical protein